MARRRAQDVLDFWFGPDPLAPAELPARRKLWFGHERTDRECRHQDREVVLRFSPLMKAAAEGELDGWASSPHRLLALVLLLDQFPRHAFRGRALAYAQDHKAMALALDGLATGADAVLPPAGRLFLYLPLQHAESAEIQEESVAAFRRLAADVPPEHQPFFAECLVKAEQHRAVIREHGRFPWRDAALGREKAGG